MLNPSDSDASNEQHVVALTTNIPSSVATLMQNPLAFNHEPTPQYVYMQDLPDLVKAYWQRYWETFDTSSSIADIDQLTHSFMSQLGEVLQDRFTYQITPLPLDNPDIPAPFSHHGRVTSSHHHIWQNTWTSFLEAPTVERQSMLKAELLNRVELTADMRKFIYNEFAVKTELCIHFLAFVAYKKTILSQTTLISAHIDTPQVESPEQVVAGSVSRQPQPSFTRQSNPDVNFAFGFDSNPYSLYQPADSVQNLLATYRLQQGEESRVRFAAKLETDDLEGLLGGLPYKEADELQMAVVRHRSMHFDVGGLTTEQQEALDQAMAIRMAFE